MDEECRLQKTNDMEFLDKLNQKIGKSEHFASWQTSKEKMLKNGQFKIKHYAGDVAYFIEGFLSKNKDTLVPDCTAAVRKSKNSLVQSLFPHSSSKSKRSFQTAATRFKESLSQLIDTLSNCRPHYVRCIKPNERKRPVEVEEERTRHQVRYLGLLENVRVRRAGFCWRTKYSDFLLRFKLICNDTWPVWTREEKDGVKKIVEAHKIDAGEVKFGKTKLFIRNPKTLFYFEDQRDLKLPQVATQIQANWRGYIQRKKYVRTIAARRIQSLVKMFVERKKYVRTIAARRMQSLVRMFVERKKYVRTIAARRIQSCIRMFVLKRKYVREYSATIIQFAYRKYRFRKYVTQLVQLFANVKTDAKLGKGADWPQPAKVLQAASIHLKKIHETWRARMMVNSLDAKQTLFVHRKIRLQALFSGKKKWSSEHQFEGNYLAKQFESSPLKYEQTVAALDKKYKDKKIVFASSSLRLTTKGKVMERDFILSETAGYQVIASKGSEKGVLFKVSEIESIEMSSFEDSWIVIKCKPPARDVLISLKSSSSKEELYTEFFMWISELLTKNENNNGKYPKMKVESFFNKISFQQKLQFNTCRDEKKAGVEFVLNLKQSESEYSKNTLVKDKNLKNNFTVFY